MNILERWRSMLDKQLKHLKNMNQPETFLIMYIKNGGVINYGNFSNSSNASL